jgi:outer membrane immunogenic protein
MKKLILALSAVALSAVGASAADMAVKALPMAAPIAYNWSGWYVGVNAGGAWNDGRDDVFPTGCFLIVGGCGAIADNPKRSDSVRLNGAGFTGGAQAGYNWQRERWVFGIEGDINFNGINDGSSINRPVVAPLVGNFIHSETAKQEWFGTLRGRVGMTVTPSFLLYGTGGLAFGQVRSASTVSFTSTADTYAGSIDQTRAGWTLGAGGEWMIAPKWSIKAEYLYVDLGKVSYTQACTNLPVCGSPPQVSPASYQTDLRVRENIVRVGLNYHFFAPVVAKY